MRHRRGYLGVSSSWLCHEFLYFLLGLVLLTNASYFVSAGSDEDDAGTAGYCQLCERHTMCRFPFDDEGPKCLNVENGDLDPEEIVSIVHQHNVQRNNIARGLETRGNPGPQPRSRIMMELTWDGELARLARRWALQCRPHIKDECRDVERFAVWQNVNTLDLDNGMEISDIGANEDPQGHADDGGSVTNTTEFMRIQYHVTSWLDEVEDFDAARVGLVDMRMENETSYVAIAGAMINRVGCGRAVYTVTTDESIDEVEDGRSEFYPYGATIDDQVPSNKNVTNNVQRFDVLVCNYGPIDRTTPHKLYDYGTLEPCPDGSSPSLKYDHLCVKTEELRDFLPRDSEDRSGEDAGRDPSWGVIVGSGDGEAERRSSSSSSSSTSNSGVSIALRESTSATTRSTSFRALAPFLSLVLLHIITKAPGARCCWSC